MDSMSIQERIEHNRQFSAQNRSGINSPKMEASDRGPSFRFDPQGKKVAGVQVNPVRKRLRERFQKRHSEENKKERRPIIKFRKHRRTDHDVLPGPKVPVDGEEPGYADLYKAKTNRGKKHSSEQLKSHVFAYEDVTVTPRPEGIRVVTASPPPKSNVKSMNYRESEIKKKRQLELDRRARRKSGVKFLLSTIADLQALQAKMRVDKKNTHKLPFKSLPIIPANFEKQLEDNSLPDPVNAFTRALNRLPAEQIDSLVRTASSAADAWRAADEQQKRLETVQLRSLKKGVSVTDLLTSEKSAMSQQFARTMAKMDDVESANDETTTEEETTTVPKEGGDVEKPGKPWTFYDPPPLSPLRKQVTAAPKQGFLRAIRTHLVRSLPPFGTTKSRAADIFDRVTGIADRLELQQVAPAPYLNRRVTTPKEWTRDKAAQLDFSTLKYNKELIDKNEPKRRAEMLHRRFRKEYHVNKPLNKF